MYNLLLWLVKYLQLILPNKRAKCKLRGFRKATGLYVYTGPDAFARDQETEIREQRKGQGPE